MPTFGEPTSESETTSMLELRAVSSGYGRVPVLREINLTVAAGESVAVLGPNGAGKTTMMRTIMGFLPLTAGELYLDGEPIGGQPPYEIARRGIGYVPEGRDIFPDLSVEENLRMGAAARPSRSEGLNSDSDDRVFATFPILEDRLRQRAGTLSGGEQQMLAMARIMVAEPKVWLLDEPSLGLAPIIADRVFEVVHGLRESGSSILLVEQSPERALAACDRVYRLDLGQAVEEPRGAPHDPRELTD